MPPKFRIFVTGDPSEHSNLTIIGPSEVNVREVDGLLTPVNQISCSKWAGLIRPPQAKPDNYVWNAPWPYVVLAAKAEEKGSDVNLGAHLVRDAFVDAFDIAYVITDDTDLVEPVRIVTQEAGKPACIVAPYRSRTAKRPVPAPSLAAVASSVHYIDDKELAAAQFPDVINRPGKKPITKPPTWV